jgi:uncharacterized surface protein with fasciclin (FAS1) repeats
VNRRHWLRSIALAGALCLMAGAAACSSSSKGATGPSGPTETTVPGPHNLVLTASYDAQLSNLATALNLAGLDNTLAGHGPYTLFAPDNTAFASLPPGRLAALLRGSGKASLSALLAYHLVRGKLLTNAMKPGQLVMLDGGKVTVSMAGGKIMLTDSHGNKATIVRNDIPASNGVIQVVNGVLLPPTPRAATAPKRKK